CLEGFFVGAGAGLDGLTGVVVVDFLGGARFVADCSLALSCGVFFVFLATISSSFILRCYNLPLEYALIHGTLYLWLMQFQK
ncbi:hypothetical protein Tco_0035025, partial [Tanacetum coccineum]